MFDKNRDSERDREIQKISVKEKRRIRRANRRKASKRRMETSVHSVKIKEPKKKERDDWMEELEDYYSSTSDSNEDGF